MFQKPSEPKPGSSGTVDESGSTAGVCSSASKTPPQQVAKTATTSNSNTTTANDSGRSDEEQLRGQRQPDKLSYSVSKQQVAATALHQHYFNYFSNTIPKEEAKSQRARGTISNTLSQHSSRPHQQKQQQQQQAVFLNQDVNHAYHHLDHLLAPPPLNQRISANHYHLQHYSNHNSNQAQIYHNLPLNYPPNHSYQPNVNVNGNVNGNSHQHHHYASPANLVSNTPRSVRRDETLMSQVVSAQGGQSHSQQMNPMLNHRTHSTGAIASSHQLSQHQNHQSHSMNQSRPHAPVAKVLTRSTRQGQLDRDSEDKVAAIKGELENDLEGCKNSELEAISSLERNLPIELSFLIRQQAHCMARMNYLDRQLRELRENPLPLQQSHSHHHNLQQLGHEANQVTSTSMINLNARLANLNVSGAAATTAMAHGKNGNFILSDDSGGEYSRATISDDDELSSLLDQIAKSVRPADQRPPSNADLMLNGQMQTLQQHQQQRVTANYSALMGNPTLPHQPQPQLQHYQPHQQHQHHPNVVFNQNQLHHQQAVPIFVMSSPIAVAHPSSINSNILPGVHFQPEPRYNQYYEDFYGHNSLIAHPFATLASSVPTVQRGFSSSGLRSQQFDTGMSAVEQLVSQKEKRQIISQLKSADNWLKMRASNNDQEGGATRSVKQATTQSQSDSSNGTAISASALAEPRTTSSSTIKQESNRVIDETRNE